MELPRFGQMYVEVCECLQHPCGTRRNEAILEAVLKRAKATKHPWLVACDVNMSPVDFEKSIRFRKDRMHVKIPEGVSKCRSKSAKGEWFEKVYDCAIACISPKGNISKMKDQGRIRRIPLWWKEKRRYRNGRSRSCRRCCLVIV